MGTQKPPIFFLIPYSLGGGVEKFSDSQDRGLLPVWIADKKSWEAEFELPHSVYVFADYTQQFYVCGDYTNQFNVFANFTQS